VTGRFNALNMLIAIVCGFRQGMSLEDVQKGTASYIPPKRRMQEKGLWRGALVIDDFGHHPTAIKQTMDAIIARYPNRRVFACFEPRTNTTTRNFYQQELVDCFAKAAGVAIGALDRPWRYSDSERLDLGRVQQDLDKPSFVVSDEQAKESDWGRYIYEWLDALVQPNDLVVTFSNGDFGGLRSMLS
jgi:UDP-N-acetylmuramate: L-alanyl-gamma-D-glutamyl-meso-diaminopimelate ligase